MTVTDIRALTIKQPWAFLIAAGIKDVENRTWAPRQFPGALLIHAGAGFDRMALLRPEVRTELEAQSWPEWPLPAGAVIAVAGTVKAHRDSIGGHCDPWGEDDCWHWELSNVRLLPEPVPAKGRLGLWRPDEDVLAAVLKQVSSVAGQDGGEA
jgi:hypothetical protein